MEGQNQKKQVEGEFEIVSRGAVQSLHQNSLRGRGTDANVGMGIKPEREREKKKMHQGPRCSDSRVKIGAERKWKKME